MAQLRNWVRVVSDNLFPFGRTATRGELIFFRIFEFIVSAWTVQFGWSWAPAIARDEVVVLPLGLANYVDIRVLFGTAPAHLLALLLTIAVVLGFARYSRWAYSVALLLFHFAYVARYSLGEISHGSNFPGLTILALALGTGFFGKPSDVYRFTFGMSFFLFGLGYTSAGFCKLIATGLGWPAAAHLQLWVGERTIDVTSTFGSFSPNVFQRLALAFPALGTAALTFGFVAEFAGLLMWFERPRAYVLTALIAMHIGVELLLNIYFGHNIYTLALLAYPWGRGIDWLIARCPRHQEPASSAV